MKISKIVCLVAGVVLFHSASLQAQVRENGITYLPGVPYPVMEYEENFTCNGGWPHTRTCKWNLQVPGDAIALPSRYIKVRKTTAGTASSRPKKGEANGKMYVKVTVGEGDVFNPGKHTTSYEVRYYTLAL